MSAEIASVRRRILIVTSRRLFYGVVVCVFSLNGILRMVAARWPGTKVSTVILSVASVPDSIYATVSGGTYFLFELFLRWVLISLGIFVALLIIGSLRHKSTTIFVSGMSGLFVGLFALTWLSILLLIVVLLRILIGWIFWFIHFIVAAILTLLLWPPILYTILSIIGIIGIMLLIGAVKGESFDEIWQLLKEKLRNLSAKPFIIVLAILASAALIWFVGVPLWQNYISPFLMAIRDWLLQYLVPVLSWIVAIIFGLLAAIVLTVLILVILIGIGWQFADQFSTARFCGQNTHTLFESGFAIGAVLGLALLVCSANPTFKSLVNVSWSATSPVLSSMDLSAAVYYLMPARAETLLQTAFAKASMPLFDVLCLLGAIILANCSLIAGLVSEITIEPLRQLVSRDRLPPLGKLLFGFFIMCAVVLGSAIGGDDS